VASLGSEYLFAALGLNVVGIYSLTSAQLLREVPLCPAPVRVLGHSIIQLSVFVLTDHHGVDASAEGPTRKTVWQVYLAAVNTVPTLLLFQVQHHCNRTQFSQVVQVCPGAVQFTWICVQLQDDDAERALSQHRTKL
jgi:hypothetical protein